MASAHTAPIRPTPAISSERPSGARSRASCSGLSGGRTMATTLPTSSAPPNGEHEPGEEVVTEEHPLRMAPFAVSCSTRPWPEGTAESGNAWVTGGRYNAGVAIQDRTLMVAIRHEEYTE